MFFVKLAITSLVVAFCSWLSHTRAELAGFIVALPLTSLLVLVFSHIETSDVQNSVRFAQSIFLGIPVSLLFFLPFLAQPKTHLGFWECLGLGVTLVIIGYFVHRWMMSVV